MTENGSRPTCQHGCHPTTLSREVPVADGVNATMNPMQPPRKRPALDSRLVESDLSQLGNRDDPVLTSGNLGDLPVGIGALVSHSATKAPGPSDSPLRPELRTGQKVDCRGEADGAYGDRVTGVAADREEDHGDRAD
jgi:hypothetical protein